MSRFVIGALKILILPLAACGALAFLSLESLRTAPTPPPSTQPTLEAINRNLAPRVAEARALRDKLIADSGTPTTVTPKAGLDGLPAEKMGIFPPQFPTYSAGIVQLLPLSASWVIVVSDNLPEVCQEIDRLAKNDKSLVYNDPITKKPRPIEFLAAQQTWLKSLAANPLNPGWTNYNREIKPIVAKYYGQARINTKEADLNLPTYYQISSPTDPNYKTPQPAVQATRFVASLGGEKYPGIDPTIGQYSYLQLPKPMVDGNTYTIRLNNGKKVTFVYDELTLVSRAIKTNQVGYLPDAKKYAYVGAFLHNLGPMTLPSGTTFKVIEVESGSAVLTGPVTLRAANPTFTDKTKTPVSGENIYELDFSSVSEPGNYFISVSGVGRSWPFTIDRNAYAEAFYTQVRGFYHQRCGIEIGMPYSPWPRIKCHTDKVGESKFVPIFYNTQAAPLATNQWNIFDMVGGSFDISRPTLDHQGGWHDAGDWDKNLRHYAIIFDLMNLYELKPTVFTDGQLNIPEGGNRIPDILDEAEYGLLVWKKSMNAKGGVSGFLETTGTGTIDSHKEKYGYAARTRWTSLLFAAAAAQFAQLVKPFDAAKSVEYTTLAVKAYQFGMDPANALKNITIDAIINPDAAPGTKPQTPYTVPFNEIDGFNQPFMVGAKLRLYLLTKDKSYVQDLPAILKSIQAGFTIPTKDKAGTVGTAAMKLMPTLWPAVPADCTLWLFAGLMQPDAAKAIPAAVIAEWRKIFIGLADTYANLNNAEFYRRSRALGQSTQMAWGAACMANPSKVLLFAHYLTGDNKYKQAALLNLDYMLGGNPTALCWTTGTGFVYPTEPHHRVSQTDNIVDPVPGIVLYGPNEGSLDQMDAMWLPLDPAGKPIKMLQNSFYTANPKNKKGFDVILPRLRNFQPHPVVAVPMNEFTIWETMTGAAFSYGYLLEEGWAPPEWLKNRKPRDPNFLFGRWMLP